MKKSEQTKPNEGSGRLETQTCDSTFEAEVNGQKYKVYEYNCKGKEKYISKVLEQCAIHEATRQCLN